MNKKENLILAKKKVTDAGLYIATIDDIEQLASIAEDAYENYPLHNWFTNGKYNASLSKKIMAISLKAVIKNGIIYSDSKDATGFAIWLPPNFKGINTFSFLAHGGISLIFQYGLPTILKMQSYENFAMALKKKHTNNKDWYLYNLSIKKVFQGKGKATELLTPMLNFCNENSYFCYLETNKEENVPIYQHFGFILKETTFIPDSSVSHFAMLKK